MFLFRQVLLKGIIRVNGFVSGSGILPSVLLNDSLATWMQLEDTSQWSRMDKSRKVSPALARIP